MSKGPRADVVALLVIASAAALGIVLLILRAPGLGRADPLTAVPVDSFLVISIDVPSLGRSPLAKALVGEGGTRTGSLLGVESMTATCGFDPLPMLRSIVVAIPEGGERGDFGVAASGDLTKEALASCARAVIAKRGGQATSREAGTFTVVSGARSPGAEPGAEVAFRDGGPFLVGRGPWLTRMMEAAEGRVPSLVTSTGDSHHALRVELAKRDADAEAIVATAILPRDLRDRLQHEMAIESQPRNSEPDRDKPGAPTMEAVLSVSAAGVSLHAGREHEETRLTGLLRCDSENACEAVSTMILHLRLRWSGNLGYRLFGLGTLIDDLEVQRQGASLFVTTHAPVDDLAKMLDRVLSPPPAPAKERLPQRAAPGAALPAQDAGG